MSVPMRSGRGSAGLRGGGLALCLLARQHGEKSTILFVTQVQTERDMDFAGESHVATIIGLEDRLVATGQTLDQARDNALELFRDLIDEAIEVSEEVGTKSIQKTLEGSQIPFVVAKKSFSQVDELFDAWTKLLNERLSELHSGDDESEKWKAVSKEQECFA
ncbi:MAG: hypothetical protein HYR73_07035 [Candidatus Eisenbacteria bacterium]|nr:hypothetical protein [Candidatus Eisenbacteria bacterium]